MTSEFHHTIFKDVLREGGGVGPNLEGDGFLFKFDKMGTRSQLQVCSLIHQVTTIEMYGVYYTFVT